MFHCLICNQICPFDNQQIILVIKIFFFISFIYFKLFIITCKSHINVYSFLIGYFFSYICHISVIHSCTVLCCATTSVGWRFGFIRSFHDHLLSYTIICRYIDITNINLNSTLIVFCAIFTIYDMVVASNISSSLSSVVNHFSLHNINSVSTGSSFFPTTTLRN